MDNSIYSNFKMKIPKCPNVEKFVVLLVTYCYDEMSSNPRFGN